MDISVFEEFLTNLYGRNDNLLLLSFALGLGVWALSGMLAALFPTVISVNWWTAVAAIAISGLYMGGRLAIQYEHVYAAMLDASELLIVVSLSWVAATLYRKVFPHLGEGITRSLLNAHREHFTEEEDQ